MPGKHYRVVTPPSMYNRMQRVTETQWEHAGHWPWAGNAPDSRKAEAADGDVRLQRRLPVAEAPEGATDAHRDKRQEEGHD